MLPAFFALLNDTYRTTSLPTLPSCPSHPAGQQGRKRRQKGQVWEVQGVRKNKPYLEDEDQIPAGEALEQPPCAHSRAVLAEQGQTLHLPFQLDFQEDCAAKSREQLLAPSHFINT